MLSKEMEKAFNAQINNELFSGYLYLAMSAFLSENYLDGFANYFKVQAKEELGHAMKMYGYVFERGSRVVLEKIDKPQADFKDVEEIFTMALEHEKKITKNIHELVELAIKSKDHASKNFLDWFVNEQVEEEANMDKWVNTIKMVGTKGQALIMMDVHAGKRE